MSTQPAGPGTCRGYTSAQIMGAISAAMKAGDMQAVTSLMLMLAVADPDSAATLKAHIDLLSLIPDSAQ